MEFKSIGQESLKYRKLLYILLIINYIYLTINYNKFSIIYLNNIFN